MKVIHSKLIAIERVSAQPLSRMNGRHDSHEDDDGNYTNNPKEDSSYAPPRRTSASISWSFEIEERADL